MSAGLFEYGDQAGRTVAVCSIDGADEICVLRHGGHEESGADEARDLGSRQEFLDFGHGKQAGLWVRLGIEQQQTEG